MDGPTEIEDLDKTDANKEVMQGFVDNLLKGGRADLVTDYNSVKQYDQHNAEVGDGLESFGRHFKGVMESGHASQYVNVHRLLGQGNFVVIFSHVKQGGDDWAVFDLLRLNDGKIVEHWDVQEKIGPNATGNNYGKF
ncbi:nuclear transport factor 2 family protein [uncultured Shimia sp.]|uniref:nuclear transport factor 2 family protein n=1 Tax=uncultured Shimia sp. TaxID=573152 RepID=UPI002624F7FA|nr:nuclear transport factor 2 family protein [uncultured Shimia sp.]